MRLAILAASTYAHNQKLRELPQVEAELDVLGQRLTEPDAGFVVHIFSAQRGLAEAIEQLAQTFREPVEELLFYFCGYAVVSDERGPALLLDGERLGSLSVKRLRRLIAQLAPHALAILDTVSPFENEPPPQDVVGALYSALQSDESSLHQLLASRPLRSDLTGRSPFTSLVELVLDWQSNSEGLSAEGLYTAMRSEESLFAELPAVHYAPSFQPFHLLHPGFKPSFSMPAPAGPALDSADSVERADALADAGDWENALVEYTVALGQLAAQPGPAHTALYAKIGAALRAVGRREDALAYFDAALAIDERHAAALRGAAELRAEANDVEAALKLLGRWLTVEPNALPAAELAAKLLSEAGRWDELARLYEFVLPRASEANVAVALSLELAAICRDQLGDPGRAFGPLERAAQLAPNELRLREPLIELCESRGDFEHALTHVLAALRVCAPEPDRYRAALRLFEKCQRPDGAWNAACVLEELGEADINESLLASTRRPEGLLPARGRIGEEEWKKKLFCSERNELADELFALLGEAAVEVGLETARRKRRLPLLEPGTEQDPEKSTATIAKTLLWTAKLLGLGVPRLHVLPDLRTELAAPPEREPTLIANKSLGSGLELSELCFLWGRHLAFLRPEHRLGLYFPSVPELTEFILAALSLGGSPQLPFKKLEGDAKLFARGLKRHLSPQQLAQLKSLSERFPLQQSPQVALSWTRAVEMSTSRAGLLASGNLEIAARMSERFPLGMQLSPGEQLSDLMAWCVSDDYATLRERLGVTVTS